MTSKIDTKTILAILAALGIGGGQVKLSHDGSQASERSDKAATSINKRLDAIEVNEANIVNFINRKNELTLVNNPFD